MFKHRHFVPIKWYGRDEKARVLTRMSHDQMGKQLQGEVCFNMFLESSPQESLRPVHRTFGSIPMKYFRCSTLLVVAVVGLALSSRANVLVNDTWQDSNRSDPASPVALP